MPSPQRTWKRRSGFGRYGIIALMTKKKSTAQKAGQRKVKAKRKAEKLRRESKRTK
jgi:hypothetical protein